MSHTTSAQNLRKQAQTLADHLPELLMTVQQAVSTSSVGEHNRYRTGKGDVFWQFRPYQIDDERRRIDWRRSARQEDLYVKDTEWQTVQTLYFWCDQSRSMHYTSSPNLQTKQQHANILTLALVILLQQAGEHTILLQHNHTPFSTHSMSIEEITTLLAGHDNDVKVKQPLTQANNITPPLPQESTVIWMSDFLDSLSHFENLMQSVSYGHLISITDPAEETFPFSGPIHFTGLEGEESLLVQHADALRHAYQSAMYERKERIKSIAQRRGWTFHTHRTDMSLLHTLRDLLMTLLTSSHTTKVSDSLP